MKFTIVGWLENRNSVVEVSSLNGEYLSPTEHMPARIWITGRNARGKEVRGGICVSVDAWVNIFSRLLFNYGLKIVRMTRSERGK